MSGKLDEIFSGDCLGLWLHINVLVRNVSFQQVEDRTPCDFVQG